MISDFIGQFEIFMENYWTAPFIEDEEVNNNLICGNKREHHNLHFIKNIVNFIKLLHFVNHAMKNIVLIVLKKVIFQKKNNHIKKLILMIQMIF